jgi:hypothetical protein
MRWLKDLKRTPACLLAVALVVSAVAACGATPDEAPDPDGTATAGAGAAGASGSGGAGNDGGGIIGSPSAGGSTGTGTTGEHCDQIDIVFVIENSPPMLPEQQLLAANFPAFFQTIDSFTTPDGDPIQYRIAVTSTGITTTNAGGFICSATTPGDDGRFRQVATMPNRWLEKTDQNPEAVFSELAAVGNACTSTCHTMPLQAMKLSLSDRIADGYNAGFLREEALLALVFLTDRDDCSSLQTTLECVPPGGLGHPGGCPLSDDSVLEPVQTYIDFLDGLKGGRERWAAAAIAAPPPSSCASPSGDGTALPATRLSGFIDITGANGVFSTVCADDLTPALAEALNTFKAACENLPPPPK